MKTETLQEQLERIGKEMQEVGFERMKYTHDNSVKGFQPGKNFGISRENFSSSTLS